MIRLVLALLAVVLFCIITLPFALVLLLIGRFNKEKKDIISLRLVQWIFKVILVIAGTKLTVIGEENVPKDTAVLYVANHRSFFDILTTYSRCPTLTGFVAKKSMLKVPFVSMWMKFLHCLFLDRHDIKSGMKMILSAVEQIKNGISVFIFPEGTRTESESELPLLDFHEGSFKIASKSGCPIIPIAMTNTQKIFERQLPFIKSATVTLEYGKPIYPDEMTKDEKKHLGAYTKKIIEEMLERNMD